MEDTHNFKKLKAHILGLSKADNFDDAKSEWELDRVCFTIDFGHCPCGKKIKEHCYLKNSKNGNKTWVGNICVNRFMEIDASKLFSALARVRKNNSAKPNEALSEYAWKCGYLYGENEYKFLKNIRGQRKSLKDKQLHWVQKINRRIVESIVVRRLPDQAVNVDEADEADGGDDDDDAVADFPF